jgi:hypothetical protein
MKYAVFMDEAIRSELDMLKNTIVDTPPVERKIARDGVVL